MQTELRKLEHEREMRDREFWISAFVGEAPQRQVEEIEDGEDRISGPVNVVSEDEAMVKSALGRR